MASAVRVSFHKRLFLLLAAFSWSIIICVMALQYTREKQYKSETLDAQLQFYNENLLATVEEGLPYEDYIAAHPKPFEDLRITIMSLQGSVVYDNTLPLDSLGDHSSREEIVDALKFGSGYHIGRYSASDGRLYFYSATRGERVIIRTAIPYSASLKAVLRADMAFVWILVAISLVFSIAAYFATRRLGMLEEQEKMRIKRELTNNINHELKTPVASIHICLETLLSGMKLSEEKRQELIERCYVNNDRLRRLLNDVSMITRMEDGSQLIGKEKVLLNDIAGEIVREMEIMPQEERMNVHVDFRTRTEVVGNAQLIGSIFRNLTENAISYSGGKNIYIRLLEYNEDLCRICFEDDGCGVLPEQLPHLFERFYRVDRGRSRKKGGTGLGLAIVKHAVQFHGGTISVSNRAGGGLSFSFTLRK